MKKVTILLLILFASIYVVGQEKASVFGGYQFTSIGGGDRTSAPKGWDVDIAGRLSKHVGVVGDISGAYKAGQSKHNFAGGVRLSAPGSKVTPFAESLFGVAHLNDGGGNHFSMLIGGGVDVHLSSKLAFRMVKFDYNYVKIADGRFDDLRFATGIVFKF